MADGHAPTHATIREMVAQITTESGYTHTLGKKWAIRFLTHHPAVRSKIGRNIDALRIQNSNSDDLNAFFTSFRRVRSESNVAIENSWNMDKSGITLGYYTH